MKQLTFTGNSIVLKCLHFTNKKIIWGFELCEVCKKDYPIYQSSGETINNSNYERT